MKPLWRRLAGAVPNAAVFGLACGPLLAALTLLGLLVRDEAIGERALRIVAVFGFGGLAGGFSATLAAVAMAGRRPPVKRFAAMLALLPVLTFCGVEFAYLMDFTGWLTALGEPPFSRSWLLAIAFAGATTLYTLIVSGLPLVMPWALVPLFLVAWVFARRPRG